MDTPLNFRAVIADYLAAHPDAHLYFLLDHAGLPGLVHKLGLNALPWTSLFADTRESTALAVAPILADVAAAGSRLPLLLLDWIAEKGAYSSCVTMLDSPLSLDALHRRLTARLDVTLSEDMHAMLRFFDPRVLAQLRTTLAPTQATGFFSVARRWWYIDRRGHLIDFDAAFAAVESMEIPMVFDRKQEFAMVDATETDQVLARLHDVVPNLMEKIPASERYQFVADELANVKKEKSTSIHEAVVHVVKKMTS